MPECVVGHQQEPGLPALCQHRLGGAGGLGVSVECPVKAGGRTFLIGQLRGRGPRQQRDLAALARKLLHCERDRGIGEIGDRGDALAVEPTARDRRGEVGLVLMISVDHLDRAAEHVAAEILDRHARREHRGRAAKVAIEPALVVEHADADRLLLRPATGRRQNSGSRHGSEQKAARERHDVSSPAARVERRILT